MNFEPYIQCETILFLWTELLKTSIRGSKLAPPPNQNKAKLKSKLRLHNYLLRRILFAHKILLCEIKALSIRMLKSAQAVFQASAKENYAVLAMGS